MDIRATKKALEAFKEYVIRESKNNLKREKKNVSSDLYNSLRGEVDAFPNSIQATFYMKPYGYYQDRGVKGKTSTYPEIAKYGTLARFGSGTGRKGGLSEGIRKWVEARRFQFRSRQEGSKGQFLSYKSTAFLITRSIWNKGIRPSLFFTKPFERALKKLPAEIEEKFGLDLESFIEFTTRQNK